MRIHPTLIVLMAVFLSAASTLCFGQLSTADSGVISEFTRELNNDLSKDNNHGSISIIIMKNARIICDTSFGYASVITNRKPDAGTIYRVGSVTKTFTATVLMQLAEEQKLKLDDAVENYVPEIKMLKGYAGANPITLRQLATHTAGLAREPTLAGNFIGPVEQWEIKLLSCIPYISIENPPGTKYGYSNIGYALLGLALERASGIPYAQLVQQRILTPLRMDNTFFAVPADRAGSVAEGIANYGEAGLHNIATNPFLQGLLDQPFGGYNVPNGGLYASCGDLAKFVMALGGLRLFQHSESFTQMQQIPPGGRDYGCGLTIDRKAGHIFIGHSGGVPGYKAQFLMEPESGYAVILLRNANNGKTDLTKVSQKLLTGLLKKMQ